MNGSLAAGWPVRRCRRSWAAEGAAMRTSDRRRLCPDAGEPVQVTVTLDARFPPDPGPWTIVPVGRRRARRAAARSGRAADFTVIIAPETRGVLAWLTRDLERAGARLLGSSSEAVLLAGEKARSGRAGCEHWASTRRRTLSIDPASGLPASASYPAVLKPIDGAGSVDTFFLEDPQSLPDECATDADGLACSHSFPARR